MMPHRRALPDGLNLPELTSTDSTWQGRRDSKTSKTGTRNSNRLSITAEKLVSMVEQGINNSSN